MQYVVFRTEWIKVKKVLNYWTNYYDMFKIVALWKPRDSVDIKEYVLTTIGADPEAKGVEVEGKFKNGGMLARSTSSHSLESP